MRNPYIVTLVAGLMLSLAGCSCDDDDDAPMQAANNANNGGEDAGNNDPEDGGGNNNPDEDAGAPNNNSNNNPGVPTTGAYAEAKKTDVDETLTGLGLKYPVHVVRDEHGIPHILAESVEDMAYVQGYIHATDRFTQMELIRSSVNGTLARAAGTLDRRTVNSDISTRVLAFRFTAEKILAAMSPEDVDYRVLESYAAGVNRYIQEYRDGDQTLMPESGLLVNKATIQDWDMLDSLALVRYQQYSLSFDSDRELRKTLARVAAEDTFKPDATDPALAARTGILGDMDRFAPIDPTYIIPGFGGGSKGEARPVPPMTPWKAPSREPLENATRFFEGLRQGPFRNLVASEGRGLSNSWAVTGAKSATGNPILANDPHLSMDNPALFHEIHLVVEPREATDGPAINAFGCIFPGLPGILIGHNEDVAWALTTASYDYSDAYLEELVWTEGEALPQVRRNGELVPVEMREETIEIGGFGLVSEQKTVQLLWVPGHGPLVPTIANEEATYPRESEGISYAWTGFMVSREVKAILGFMTAGDTGEIQTALEDWVIGTQNLIFADTSGNVLQTGRSFIPTRPPEAMTWDPETNPNGTAPWWVLSGTGEHDWTGQVPLELVPEVLNPEAGYVVTANNDQAGVTDDNNPLNDYAYIGYDYAIGFRAGRIKRRLAGEAGEFDAAHKWTPEEVGDIQFDVFSTSGERMRPFLLETLDRALAEYATPGAAPELASIVADHPDDQATVQQLRDLLAGWNLQAEDGLWGTPTDAQRTHSQATSFYNVWMGYLLPASFNDELAAAPGMEGGSTRLLKAALWLLEHPEEAATWDAERGESVLWDDLRTPEVQESRHAIFLATFFRAVDKMPDLFGSAEVSDWLWGKVHVRKFESIIPSLGDAHPLNLPTSDDPRWPNGYPRGGDLANVDRCDGSFTSFNYSCGGGSIMRFLVDLDPNGIRSWNTIPGGEVWDYRHPHYRDLLDLWLNHERHPIRFQPEDVNANVQSHTVALP